jgi:hypothetical protein
VAFLFYLLRIDVLCTSIVSIFRKALKNGCITLKIVPLLANFVFMKKNILLIDGIGAVLSAATLLLFLLFDIVGLGKMSLLILLPLPIILAIFSLFSHFNDPNKRISRLRITVLGNLLYILLSAAVVLYNHNDLTTLGTAYFALELLIIAVLVYFEIEIIKNE